MNAFTLDTSGVISDVPGTSVDGVGWGYLDPLTQGYLEALFADMPPKVRFTGEEGEFYTTTSFRDLAPETLAAILKDCADRQRQQPYFSNLFDQPHECGARFWRHRNEGGCKNFPPLTAYLGEDGKVYLRAAQ